MSRQGRPLHLDWVDPLRALALLGILLNHLVEEFGAGPWFTNPSNGWPDLHTRLATFFPAGDALPVAGVRFLGWLGDAGPGVFILLSGLGLTLAAAREPLAPAAFWRRRLLRLFPLYLAVHVVVLGAALLVPGSTLTFAAPSTLLSLLGLRATPELFFAISPSWWFVWLILQLYAVFPLLHAALRRLGRRRFFVVALAVTIAARGAGLLWSEHLYYWMTGLFFGTRLAEFAAGMVLADWLLARVRADGALPAPPVRRALPAAALCWLLGLAASFTLPTTVVSNLLVTLGLSGLGWVLWTAVLRPRRRLAAAVTWLGVQSYAVFLLHQPPLQWTAVWFPGRTGGHLAAALLALAVSVPAAWGLERAVTALRAAAARDAVRRAVRPLLTAGALALVAALGVETRLVSPEKLRIFAWLVAVSGGTLLWGEVAVAGSAPERWVRRTALLAAAAELFALPEHHGDLAMLAAAVAAAAVTLAERRLVRPYAWLAGGAAAALLLAGSELELRHVAPLESGGWGERPALEPHPTRGYALRPNATTHLRYNDYDYILRTNAWGLASPPIPLARPTPDALRVLVLGDAFSMPEGVPYERSYPALLERRLAACLAPRPVQVINAGVTGYGPAEELPQLRELLPLFRPDVVVYQFFVNEFAEQNLTPAERLWSIGLVPRSPSRRDRALEELQLGARLARTEAALGERVTGRPAPARYDEALLEFYRAGANPLYAADNLARLDARLAAMRDTARGAGAAFHVYYVPGAVQVADPAALAYFPRGEPLGDTTRYDLGRPWRLLGGACTRLGLACTDLTPALRASTEQPVYFPTSWHWTPAGHAVAARAIAAEVLAGDCPHSPTRNSAAP